MDQFVAGRAGRGLVTNARLPGVVVPFTDNVLFVDLVLEQMFEATALGAAN